MRLRPATRDDLALLRAWDDKPHVIESDPSDDWNWEVDLRRTPDWREQLIAEVDGVPIGVLQIINPAREESHYWGDCGEGLRAIDIWIGEESHLGRGFGTEMMSDDGDRTLLRRERRSHHPHRSPRRQCSRAASTSASDFGSSRIAPSATTNARSTGSTDPHERTRS